MSAVEIAIPRGIASQVSIPAWVRGIGDGRMTEEALNEEVRSAFAEFGEFVESWLNKKIIGVPLVTWRYIQTLDGRLKCPGYQEDALTIALNGVRWDSERSRLEYEGFDFFANQMMAAREASFGIWASPPGKEKKYDHYGFIYIGSIPENNEGKSRKIDMLALKIDHYDEEHQEDTVKLLSCLSQINKNKGGNSEKILLQNPIVFPVGKVAPLADVYPKENRTVLVRPSEQKIAINTIQDLFCLIKSWLPDRVDLEAVMEGLAGNLKNKVEQKYGKAIRQISSGVLALAKDYKSVSKIVNLVELMAEYFPHVQGGSCPVASSNSLDKIESGDNDKEDKEEFYLCPICGEIKPFRGRRCVECGYRLGDPV